MHDYITFHRKRFRYLIGLVKEFTSNRNAKVLEIGRGPFTKRLYEHCPSLTTLGFDPLLSTSVANLCSTPSEIPHIIFDLNDAQYPEKWVKLSKFDLIVFAEVIEHLYTAPELVLAFLKQGLSENGLIIVQTPNAASLHNRLKMLLGRNPFPRIKKDNTDPGHFREYTKKELIEIGNEIGLKSVRHEYKNYFGHERTLTKILDFCAVLFPALRRGQTLIFQNNKLPY